VSARVLCGGWLCGLLLLTVASKARAEDLGDPFYFFTDVGAALFANSKLKSSDASSGSGTFNIDPGLSLDVGFGCRFADHLAAELETGLIGATARGPVNEFGTVQDYDLLEVPILAKLVYEIPTRSRFRPYLGVGLGAVGIELDQADFFFGSSDSNFGLAWEATAGCRYQITAGLELGVVYKYLGTSNRQFDALNLEMKGTQAHRVAVALKLRF